MDKDNNKLNPTPADEIPAALSDAGEANLMSVATPSNAYQDTEAGYGDNGNYNQAPDYQPGPVRKFDSIKARFNWISGATSTRIGGRAENQDSVAFADTPFGFLVTVCDGMGGGPGGALASQIACREIIAGVKEGNPEDTRANIMRKAIRRANNAIIETGRKFPMLQGMGSTCTVVLLNATSAIVAHVGDSRIYLIRGKKKKWRTFDHSMVFGLVKQGVITEEQARLSAESNIITRALGIKLDVEVDCEELPFERGDRFILSTDGIHGSMPEKELISIVSNRQKPDQILVEDLADKVDELGNLRGGRHDNHTIAIIDIKRDSKLKEQMNRRTKQILIVMAILLAVSIIFNVFLAIVSDNMSPEKETAVVANAPADTVVSLQKVIENDKKQIEALNDSIITLNQNNDSLKTELDKLKSMAEGAKSLINGDLKGSIESLSGQSANNGNKTKSKSKSKNK